MADGVFGWDTGGWTLDPEYASQGWSLPEDFNLNQQYYLNQLSPTDTGGYTYTPPAGEAQYYDALNNPITQQQYTTALLDKLAMEGAAQEAATGVPYTPPSQDTLSKLVSYGGDLNKRLQQAGITSGLGGLLTGGAQLAGGYLNAQAGKEAAERMGLSAVEAARIGAEAAKFRPVGVTSRFGGSQFGLDALGNLLSAGYALSPELLAQQNVLMAQSGQGLTQAGQAPTATAPMSAAAGRMMSLGNQYLATDPAAQAAKYLSEQQLLLAPSREREMAALQARLNAQGRGGLAMGGTADGMRAANPELEAYYNAKMQEDRALAAQATQGGQQYAQFGAGMVGSGGNMLRDVYGTQAAAYSPYQAALGGATTLEGLGQQTMDTGVNIGARSSSAAANAGSLLSSGMMTQANIVGQQAMKAGSPWGNMLQGGAQAITDQNNAAAQQQFQNALLASLATNRAGA